MTSRFIVLACAGALLALPTVASADEGRFLVQLRGGALVRADSGYAEHAEVFGLASPAVGGGGVIDVGGRVAPRLWLIATTFGFTSTSDRRLDSLKVSNRALIGQLGLTAFQHQHVTNDQPLSVRIDALAGAGIYRISDSLDQVSRSDSGPGLRAGTQVTVSWRAIGLVVGYGHHFTRAQLSDRLGGELRAGGHEIGAGLALRW